MEETQNQEELKKQHQFQKGARVEITSHEEGFKGAWYTATILDHPSPNKRTRRRDWALVQYATLVNDTSSAPLKEHVDPTLIRPSPPPPEEDDLPVPQLNDVVDAWYKDGWWTGVVRKALEGSRFRVFFDNPPDLIEFRGKDLRPHLDWVDGNWVRPGPKEMSDLVFGSGEAVEVNVEKGNVRDGWFPAVVVKENGDNTFLVKLESSRASVVAKRVVVGLQHIRPAPPCSLETSFELLEKVEAQYDSCWRPGVITKVVAGDRFTIFFKQGNEVKEFKKSDLRPHFVWVDGKWKFKDSKLSSDSQKQLIDTFDEDGMVEVAVEYETSGATADAIDLKAPRSISILSLMDQPSYSNEKPLLDDFPLRKKKIKLAAPSGNRLFSDSSKHSAEQDSAESPLFLKTLQSKKMPTVTSATKMHSGLATQNLMHISKRLCSDQPSSRTEGSSPNTGRRCIKKHVVVDQPSTKVDSQVSGKKPVRKVVDTYNKKLDIVTSKGRATKSPFSSSKALARAKESEVADSAAQPINALEVNANVVDVPVILGLEARGSNIKSEHPHPTTGEDLLDLIRDGGNNSNISDGDKILMNEKPKGRRSSQKRKRGTPTRFVVEMSKTVEAGEGGSCVGDDTSMILKDHADGVEPLTETEHESADARKVLGEKLANDVGITGALTYEADDDQPLSLWFLHPCPTTVEESRSSSEPLANGGSDTAIRQVTAAVDCHAISVEQNQVEDEERCPPFQKKSPIWKTIESMEVFQLIPQNPHFLPLVKCKDEYREGSAIGFMVTFASLFDKVSSLKFDDPRSIFESVLESLLDLEKHGFDIAVLQDRLNQLLSIKDRQGGFLNESLDAEKLITEQASERKVLAAKMEDIQKQMAKLQEEYAASESKARAMDLQISKLQSEVDSARSRINDARNNFEQLVNAPWRLP